MGTWAGLKLSLAEAPILLGTLGFVPGAEIALPLSLCIDPSHAWVGARREIYIHSRGKGCSSKAHASGSFYANLVR